MEQEGGDYISTSLVLCPWPPRTLTLQGSQSNYQLKINHKMILTTDLRYSQKEALSANAKMLLLIWRQKLTWTDVKLFIVSVWIFMCFAAELETLLIMECWPGLSWGCYIMLGMFCGSFFFCNIRKILNFQTYLTQIASDQSFGTSIICKLQYCLEEI